MILCCVTSYRNKTMNQAELQSPSISSTVAHRLKDIVDCSSVPLTDTILCSCLLCALRLQTRTPSCVNPRRRNPLWKTTEQRPSHAPSVGIGGTGVEAEESRARRAPKRSPAMSRLETGPGPHAQWPSLTPRTLISTATGNGSRGEPITVQQGVVPL